MCIPTFFMYFTAIICIFFINANNIYLHCTTKINKLLHKLSCIIYYITKSNSQLNLPLFSVFLTPLSCWLFMLLSLPLYSFFFLSYTIHLMLLRQWNLLWVVLCFYQIAIIIYSLLHWVIKVIWFFCYYCFIAALWHSVYINVSWLPSRLKLRVDLKGNRSLNTLKNCHSWHSGSLFVFT